MDRKRTTYLLLGGAAALLLYATASGRRHVAVQDPPARPEPLRSAHPPSARPQVDVVFVLDTTGSMSALLDGAKRKIWEIARFIEKGQPAPELRIGLIGYRDINDDYVTRFHDLTNDLDEVYRNLSAFTASGGGDTPEHVSKALHEAVFRTSWHKTKNSLRLIYLVGDAPPHTDYDDGLNHLEIAKQAGQMGIRINTIRCGMDEDTRVAWTEIASRSHGEFATIDQSGGMVQVSTPYDDELAQLNGRLTATAIGYGSAEAKNTVRRKAMDAVAAPKAVQAERAGLFGLFMSRGRVTAVSGEDDLVDAWEGKRVTVEAMAKEELPEPMQRMNVDERKSFLMKKSSERKEILDRINAVSAKRDAYLKDRQPAALSSFDNKVRDSLKRQAADVGLAY